MSVTASLERDASEEPTARVGPDAIEDTERRSIPPARLAPLRQASSVESSPAPLLARYGPRAGGAMLLSAMVIVLVAEASMRERPVRIPSVHRPAPVSPLPVRPAETIELASTTARAVSVEGASAAVESTPPLPVTAQPVLEPRPERLAVIVHGGSPIASLSTREIRRIYLEDRTWSDGTEAKPVGRYQAPALRRAFMRHVLQTTHEELRQYWEAKRSEGLDRVRRLPTDEAVVRYVARRPGALGYVDWARLSPELRRLVKPVFELDLR